MTYILVDTANTFFRARHVVQGSADIKLGMAFHITFNSIKKAWNDFGGTHVIFCLEGRSWRKDFYKPYKANRQETRAAMTQREQDEDKLFWEAFDEFKNFVAEKTNCTVMQHSRLEADDLIAGWVQAHPNDKHVIISTDGDFAQLIKHNVSQYNGVGDLHITHEGTFDAKGKPVKDKKVKAPIVKKPLVAPTTFRKTEASAPSKFIKEPAGKFEMEFVIRASEDMVFEFVSTESGLSEWFCDDVNIRDGIFTFNWDGQIQQAKLVKELPPISIRYQWLDKNDGSYFEFKTQKDELTNDISLIITDFAIDKADEISAKLLWHSQVDKLLHVLGSFF